MSTTPPEPDLTGQTPSSEPSQPPAKSREASAARRTAAGDVPSVDPWEPPPNGVASQAGSGNISLLYFWNIFKKSKLIISIITLLFALWGVYKAYTDPLIYQSTVTLMPTQQSQGSLRNMLSTLGQSVSLLPRSLMSISSAHKVTKALAIIESNEFIAAFIQEENLRRKIGAATKKSGFKLISDLRREYSEFKASIVQIPERVLNPERYERMQASLQSGAGLANSVRRFKSRHMRVDQEPLTQLVTISIYWNDPEIAAEVANKLAARLNMQARTEAINESRLRIKHLEEELRKTSLVGLRQSIYALIEMEINQITVAEAEPDFVFEVIDPALPPSIHLFVQPARVLIMAGSTVFGLGFSCALAIALAYLRELRAKAKGS